MEVFEDARPPPRRCKRFAVSSNLRWTNISLLFNSCYQVIERRVNGTLEQRLKICNTNWISSIRNLGEKESSWRIDVVEDDLKNFELNLIGNETSQDFIREEFTFCSIERKGTTRIYECNVCSIRVHRPRKPIRSRSKMLKAESFLVPKIELF